MTTKVILYFPSDATDKAVTYDLVKRYDLRINILRAEIEAGRSGSAMQRSGSKCSRQSGAPIVSACGKQASAQLPQSMQRSRS